MSDDTPKFTTDEPIEIRVQIPCKRKFGNVDAVDIRIPVSREFINEMPHSLNVKAWFVDAVFKGYFEFLKREEASPV